MGKNEWSAKELKECIVNYYQGGGRDWKELRTLIPSYIDKGRIKLQVFNLMEDFDIDQIPFKGMLQKTSPTINSPVGKVLKMNSNGAVYVRKLIQDCGFDTTKVEIKVTDIENQKLTITVEEI